MAIDQVDWKNQCKIMRGKIEKILVAALHFTEDPDRLKNQLERVQALCLDAAGEYQDACDRDGKPTTTLFNDLVTKDRGLGQNG